MIRVHIDTTACNGYGNCIVAAPKVFDIDPDTNIAHTVPGRPIDADADDVYEASADCPVQAIRVER
ncbi:MULTISPECIES: ferredoxin [Gordonia]|uniref:ferredoxin n=1 Tax=Gordonia TaxID=2053 RepID=UPI0025797A10|nr:MULTISPECIES: ferredoxin [Gordonia]